MVAIPRHKAPGDFRPSDSPGVRASKLGDAFSSVWRRIADVESSKSSASDVQLTCGHTSEMPDRHGTNKDHDHRYMPRIAMKKWLASKVLGTTNQITVTDNADGSVTLSTPQDTHTGATPQFAGMALTGNLAIGANYISNDGDNEGISIDVTGAVTLSSTLSIGSIAALGTAATTFLTTDSGVVKSRTPAQVLSDIGGLADSMATERILGRGTAGSGSIEEMALSSGAGLSFTWAASSLNIGSTTDAVQLGRLGLGTSCAVSEDLTTAGDAWIGGNLSVGSPPDASYGLKVYNLDTYLGGSVTMAAAVPTIVTDTSDGSDSKALHIGSGGAIDTDRGAFVSMYGNEEGSYPGYLILSTGNLAGAEMRFYTGSAPTYLAMTLDRDLRCRHYGEVGIGTAPDASYSLKTSAGAWFGGDVGIGRSPTADLDVYSTSVTSINCETNNTASAAEVRINCNSEAYCLLQSFGDGYPAGTHYGLSRAGATFLRAVDGGLGIGTHHSFPLHFGTDNQVALVFDTSQNARFYGNVGITAAPISGATLSLGSASASSTATPLNINLGGTYANSTGDQTKAKLILYDGGSSVDAIGISAAQFELHNNQGAMAWYYQGTLKAKLDHTGTATDFNVYGAEGGPATIYLRADNGDDAGDIWRIRSDQTTNYLYIRYNSGGTNSIYLSATGDFYAPSITGNSGSSTGDVVHIGSDQIAIDSSSARYKGDVQDMTDAWSERIWGLSPVSYRGRVVRKERVYQEDRTKPYEVREIITDELLPRREVGFIAEDAHALGLNEIVYYDDDGEVRSFNYRHFTAALFNELRRLRERVAVLEAA